MKSDEIVISSAARILRPVCENAIRSISSKHRARHFMTDVVDIRTHFMKRGAAIQFKSYKF